MAVFISVTTSAFAGVLDATRQDLSGVRRPLRGLQIKEDTYAIIRVLTATGEELELIDSGAAMTQAEGDANVIGRSTRNSNFIIQSITDQRAEKKQIIETFGEDYVFFFGESPRFLDVQGVLPNSADFDWKNEWWENYETHLRGTRLVERNARMYLYFDDVVVEGYIVTSSTSYTSDQPHLVPFAFQLFVTNYATVGSVGNIVFQDIPDLSIEPDGSKLLAEKYVQPAGGGGVAGVMSQIARFRNDASFSVQNTLENIRNQFVSSSGALSVRPPPDIPPAYFPPAETGRPIHTMHDEYVTGGMQPLAFDQKALGEATRRAEAQSSTDLATAIRTRLQLRGIDPTSRETEFLMLGRQSFSALKSFGSFGIRRAGGELLTEDLPSLPESARGMSLL